MGLLDDTQKAAQKAAQDATQKATTAATLHAGRALAQRALDELTLTADERAAKAAAAARQRKKTLVLVVIGATVAGVAGIALFNLIAHLWLYAIGLVVVAGALGIGALVMKPRIDAVRARLLAGRAARTAAAEAEAARADAERARTQAEHAKQQAAAHLESELERLKRSARNG
jgi:hypothetical protein